MGSTLQSSGRLPLPRGAIARPGARPRRSANDARGSPTLIPRGIEAMGCDVSYDIGAIGGADVVYALRMQQERMAPGAAFVPSLREYAARWGITTGRLRAGQVVMDPGPMNRGVEIETDVADSEAALVTEQVRSGWLYGWRFCTTCSRLDPFVPQCLSR